MNKKLLHFAEENNQFFRDSNISGISEEFMVDRITQYGDISHLKGLIKIIGKEKYNNYIRKLSAGNFSFSPSLLHYLNLLLGIYDQVSLGDTIRRAKTNQRTYRKV